MALAAPAEDIQALLRQGKAREAHEARNAQRRRAGMPTSSTYIELGGGYDTNLYIGIAAGQVAGLPLGVVIEPGQSSIRQAV